MTNQRNVWIFIEQEEGRLAEVSLELLGKGRDLANRLGSQLVALLPGYQTAEMAQDMIHYGADRVLLVNHPELAQYRTLPYARIAIDLIRQHRPYIFLVGASHIGRDLAPRVASAVKAGLTADCTDLQIGDYKDYTDLLYQIRPAFGGNLIATIVNPHMHPQMATVREGVMRKPQPDTARQGVIETVEPAFEPGDFALQVLSRETRQSKVNLKEATTIVAGGGGLTSPEEVALLQELAHVLGGQVGASRAAVDRGLISREHQVGQTGTTVRPRLYIAAGISGAVQHRAGMDESHKIIAINTDPDAPIFGIAHYKIVGDLKEVVPMIIEALREKAK
jgi:electron transfer flavoprotein alpha subunit